MRRITDYDSLRNLLFRELSRAEKDRSPGYGTLLGIIQSAGLEADYQNPGPAYTREIFLEQNKKKTKDADETVLAFIADFLFCYGDDSSNLHPGMERRGLIYGTVNDFPP